MNIIDKLKFEEGDKASVYKCPTGHWTIGAGINLEQQGMPDSVLDLWASLGMPYRDKWMLALMDGGEMPWAVRDLWFDEILIELGNSLALQLACRGILILAADMDDMINANDTTIVLIDMAYQMGVSRLMGFNKMLAAIKGGDNSTAADELLNSKYARQTPNRANRNAELLRGCA